MKSHELIAGMDRGSSLYRSAMAAIKFDLGDADSAVAMINASSYSFYKLPAPLCLFEVQVHDQTQWFLAQESGDRQAVFWQAFVKSQGVLSESTLTMLVYEDGTSHCGRKNLTDKNRSVSAINFDEMSVGEREAANAIMGVARAIEVFSCCNVATVEHKPPAFINKKRIAKGKVPFFSYRTLHIKEEESDAKCGHTTGSHASPRLHLRRGHIRRLQDGRRTWVRATLVGDKSKGFAAKDYAVWPHTKECSHAGTSTTRR